MMARDCHFKPPELCFSGAVNHSSAALWLMLLLKPSGYLLEKYKIVFKGSFRFYQKTLEITCK